MNERLSLVKKIDLLMKEKSFLYGTNSQEYSKQTKDEYYQDLLAVLKEYNKEYLEDLGINLIGMNFNNQFKQLSERN